MSDSLFAQHLRELTRKMPVFGVFAAVSTDAKDLAVLQTEAASIVEIAVAHDLVGAAAVFCAEALMRAPDPLRHQRFSAWHETLANAVPDRTGMTLALGSFADWLGGCPDAEDALCTAFPRIAPVLGELRSVGVAALLAVTRTSRNPSRLLEAVAAYGSTDAATVTAVASLGALTEAWQDNNVLERLLQVIPQDRTDADRDAERVIPAIQAFAQTCAQRSEAHARASIETSLTLAAGGTSSAYAFATAGLRVWSHLEPETSLPWLEDTQLLARSSGIRCVGFILKTLPGMYAQYGINKTRKFVRAATEIAETYGITAGQHFYERRTAAARASLTT